MLRAVHTLAHTHMHICKQLLQLSEGFEGNTGSERPCCVVSKLALREVWL